MINNNEMNEDTRSSVTNDVNFFVNHGSMVHLLVVAFGISAWIGVNGIYVQLPLLVINAPEGWNLAAYLIVMIQAANVGPAFYTLSKKYFHPCESTWIITLLVAGSSSMIVLAFFHKKTFHIGDTEYSVILLICSFFTALLGCTSSVLFMPYLRNTTESYLISYFIGEGLSGFLPSIVALVQGVGGNAKCVNNNNGTIIKIFPQPRFTSTNYFIVIFGILVLSLWSFKVLQRVLTFDDGDGAIVNGSSNLMIAGGQFRIRENLTSTDGNLRDYCKNDDNETIGYDDVNIGFFRTIYLFVVVGLVCMLGNGFLPGIQTYSCLPYGNVAFHLTVTLSNMANPTSCFIYMWINSVNMRLFDGLTFFGAITCGYVIFIGAMSPNPPWKNSVVGVSLIIVAWIVVNGIISYLKLFVASTVKRKFGPGSLIGVGIVMQLGSACGALLSFGIINYTTIFRQQISCDDF